MTIISGKKPTLIVIILASIFSAGMALWCMASGIGVNPDSVAFLGVADSIIAGQGVRTVAYHLTPQIAGGEPLTVSPPTYPLLLSLSGRLSADRLNGARWLNALLFAASVFLVGMITYLCTEGSVSATLASILLFQLSPHMLDIYAMAWSEPPFICFVLLAALFLVRHISKPNYLTLICAALSAGLALTTRYVGITILPPMILTILLLEDKQLRIRIKDSLILAGVGIFPLAAWLVRNMLLAHTTTSRTLAFHPIGVSNLKRIVNTQLLFWVPVPVNIYFKTALLVLGGSFVLSGVALTLKHNLRREPGGHLNAAVQMFSAVFVATYFLFILAYNSLVSPAAEVDVRGFSPVYVFVIILAVSVVYQLSKLWDSIKLWRGFLTLMFALILLNSVHTVSYAVRRHENGSWYASREWAGSKTINYMKASSDTRTTYSNGVDAIHFLTGKDARRIPAKIDPASGQTNPEFEREMNSVRNELMQNRAIVIYLDKITWRWYLPSASELENVYRMPVLVRLDDGVIYGIK
jgi:hypothetical protein